MVFEPEGWRCRRGGRAEHGEPRVVLPTARALAAERMEMTARRLWVRQQAGGEEKFSSVVRGQATEERREAARRQRAAKAALMAEPRTNAYLQRKRRARLARPEPEPEPEPRLPATVHRGGGRVAHIGLDAAREGEASPSVGVAMEPVEPSADNGRPAPPSTGEVSQMAAQSTRSDDRAALASPVVPVEHSSTDIALAELRRQQAAFYSASIGVSGTGGSSDDENEVSYVDLELTSATAPSQRGGFSATQGLHTSLAVEELRRARDAALAGSVMLNDDASPWRSLQPGERGRATEQLSAQQALGSQAQRRVAEGADNAGTDDSIRHAEATRALLAEHAEHAVQLRQEREGVQSRCFVLEAQIADTQAELLAARAEVQTLTKCLSDAAEHAAVAASAAAAEADALRLNLSQAEPALATLQCEKRGLEASLVAERAARREAKTVASKQLADMVSQLQVLRQELLRQQQLTRDSDDARAAAESAIAQRVSAAAADEAMRAQLESQLADSHHAVEKCKQQNHTLAAELAAARQSGKGCKTQPETATDKAMRAELESKLADSQHEVEQSKLQIHALNAELAAARQTARAPIAETQRELAPAHEACVDTSDAQTSTGRRDSFSGLEVENLSGAMPSSPRNDSRRRRLSQMRHQLSLDSGVAQMHARRELSVDSGVLQISNLDSSVPPAPTSPRSSPSAARARQRAERNWHLAFSKQEVHSLRKRIADLQTELETARHSLAERCHTQSEHDETASTAVPAESSAVLTEEVEKVRAEVTATAKEQARVMNKLQWIQQQLLHKVDTVSTDGEATAPACDHAVGGHAADA